MNKPFAWIIEDDRNTAAMFRHVLDLAGFESEIILDGQAAMDRLFRGRPDLVLLDLNLPGVPGSLILERIRKEHELSHTRVIVITGQAHLAEGLKEQPDLLLQKPVSISQLTVLIQRIVLSDKSPSAVPLRKNPLDRLSGLYNQSFFKTRLESSIRQSREIDPYLFTVLLFKLERSKLMDKRSVHFDWETVLREVGGSIRKILRPTDTIARFDPDTFYILIENVPNGEVAIKAANRIQDILYRNIPDLKQKIKTPIRVGILLCNKGYESAEVVLNDAKYALILASAQGEEYAKFYYQVSTKNLRAPDRTAE